MTTKKITYHAQLYPGWERSMFPPALNPYELKAYPGAVAVKIAVELPVLPETVAAAGVVESIKPPAQ